MRPRPLSLFCTIILVSKWDIFLLLLGSTYISIDIVRVDSVASFVRRVLDPRLHDTAHVVAVCVDPLLTGPPIKVLALVAVLEIAGVVAPVLVGASTEVANDFLAQIVELVDYRLVVVEHVNVVDVDIGRDARVLLVEVERI